jgi:hypothetical protein
MAVVMDQIDPNSPCFKTVFKAQMDKLTYSRNAPEFCEFCRRIREPGKSAFPLCAGCREARFCSKEHQVQFWPQHKAYCKERQKYHKDIEEKDVRREATYKVLGLPGLMERRRTLEDWVEVHRHSLEQALVLNNRATPIDFRKQHAVFSLSYRRESGGNPSTAFTLNSAVILNDPPPGSKDAAGFGTFRLTMEEADAEMRRDDPGYIGALPTVYFFDNEFTWMSCTYLNVYAHDILKLPEADPAFQNDWRCALKYFTDKGLVFRAVGPTISFWDVGLMAKSGNKWIWKKKSIKELKSSGINLVTKTREW